MTLDDLRRLGAAATPGPWTADSARGTFKVPCEKMGHGSTHTVEIDTCDGRAGPTCEFIAAARSHWDALLAVAAAAKRQTTLHDDELAAALAALEAIR